MWFTYVEQVHVYSTCDRGGDTGPSLSPPDTLTSSTMLFSSTSSMSSQDESVSNIPMHI